MHLTEKSMKMAFIPIANVNETIRADEPVAGSMNCTLLNTHTYVRIVRINKSRYSHYIITQFFVFDAQKSIECLKELKRAVTKTKGQK